MQDGTFFYRIPPVAASLYMKLMLRFKETLNLNLNFIITFDHLKDKTYKFLLNTHQVSPFQRYQRIPEISSKTKHLEQVGRTNSHSPRYTSYIGGAKKN